MRSWIVKGFKKHTHTTDIIPLSHSAFIVLRIAELCVLFFFFVAVGLIGLQSCSCLSVGDDDLVGVCRCRLVSTFHIHPYEEIKTIFGNKWILRITYNEWLVVWASIYVCVGPATATHILDRCRFVGFVGRAVVVFDDDGPNALAEKPTIWYDEKWDRWPRAQTPRRVGCCFY